MTRPDHFTVAYAINPWMDPRASVDTLLAVEQWEGLVAVYRGLGHVVDVVPALSGLPDMVYAANGGLLIDGIAIAARFAHPERAPEGPAYAAWLRGRGVEVRETAAVNEGEGDLLVAGSRILAGWGFRTQLSAHAEIGEITGREVVSLELVDPRYYHLDTALAVLDDDLIAYFPGAFSPWSVARLEHLYPDAVIVGESDAAVLGLNAVSDGANVVLTDQVGSFAGQLAERGFIPVPVNLSELLKGGGSVKCCTLEVRP